MVLSFGASSAVLVTLALFAAYLPRPRFLRSAELPAGFTELDASFGDNINVIGFRVDQPEVYPRTGLFITLIWQVEETPCQSYNVFVHLWNQQGEQIGVGDLEIGGISHPARLMPTWPPGAVFQEQVMVRVPQETIVPVAGTLPMGVYNSETGERLAVTDSEDNSVFIPICVRVVERFPYAPDEPTQVVDARFADMVTLHGFTLGADSIQAGDTLTLDLVWFADGPLAVDAVIFIHVINSAWELDAQSDAPPLGGALPTSLRLADDKWLDSHALAIPDDLPAGAYTVKVGLYNWADGVRVPITDEGSVVAQDHALTLTTLQVE